MWPAGTKRSFQRTYEELKQNREPEGALAVLGFQRTYEELKLRQNTYKESDKIRFSAYLRGIET